MTCRACRSDRLDPVFSVDPMPLAGSFPATAALALALPKFPLTWLLCYDCGLVNVEPDIPDDVIYRTYSYAASTVPALVRHHAGFAKVLMERYREPVRLLEIGCNDGVLLDNLPDTWDLVGVDPSDVAREAAHGKGYHLLSEAFGHGGDLLPDYFDVVTSSNSFAHFTDIAGALEGVNRVLKPGGEFWLEVHSLEATLNSRQWDTIYHEHKVEWSVWSLRSVVRRYGFEEVGCWAIPLHGGSLRILFRKAAPTRIDGWRPDFGPLQRAYDERVPVRADVAYGAAARASVYLNQCDTGVAYVVDGSPLRAARFMPGLGVPIVEPAFFDRVPPPKTLITAWNHADDIKARHPGYDGWVTAW